MKAGSMVSRSCMARSVAIIRCRLQRKPRRRAWTPPRTPDGQPDLQGIWNNATGTPMERPDELKGKEFFTEQEALDWEKTMAARNKRDDKACMIRA